MVYTHSDDLDHSDHCDKINRASLVKTLIFLRHISVILIILKYHRTINKNIELKSFE